MRLTIIAILAIGVTQDLRPPPVVAPGIYLISASADPGLCLESAQAGEGNMVTLSRCSQKVEGQQWSITKSPAQLGMSLIDRGGGSRWFWTPAVGTTSGKLTIGVKVAGSAQRWELLKVRDNAVLFRTSDGRCLTVVKAPQPAVVLDQCQTGVPSTQVWSVRLISAQ